MVQILNEPKFPVIRELPDTREILQGFRASDWRNMTLVTVLSAPFGYYAGRPLVMRPMMYGSMGISAVFGFILGWEKAHARVMGFRENAPEVAKFAELDAKAATAAVGDKETVAASSAEAASSTSGQSS